MRVLTRSHWLCRHCQRTPPPQTRPRGSGRAGEVPRRRGQACPLVVSSSCLIPTSGVLRRAARQSSATGSVTAAAHAHRASPLGRSSARAQCKHSALDIYCTSRAAAPPVGRDFSRLHSENATYGFIKGEYNDLGGSCSWALSALTRGAAPPPAAARQSWFRV